MPNEIRRILVVDDNVDGADSLAMVLSHPHYQIRTAYHGAQAVAVAAEFKPHLIILDINMPVMNGFEAARTLRVADPAGTTLRLIALTGMVAPTDRVEALNSGFDMILPKPIEGSAMRHLVDSVLAETPPA